MNQRVTSMRKLLNPLTKEYQELKRFILSDDFPWYIHQETVVDCKKELPNWAYTHMILNRPEINRFAQSFALKPEEFVQIASQILELNGYKEFFFLRMCVNSTHPQPEKQRIGGWHTDHPYKHHKDLLSLLRKEHRQHKSFSNQYLVYRQKKEYYLSFVHHIQQEDTLHLN